MSDREPAMLDLSEYVDRDTALRLAAEGCPQEYTTIARESLEDLQDIHPETLVFMAMLSRARGLHEGTLQAIRADNPHAALPLLRAFCELVAVVYYCLYKPEYVARLSGSGSGSQKGYSKFSQMFEAISDELSGMANVYSELSEYTHFQKLAVYNAHSIDDDEERRSSWTDVPRWKSDAEFYIACAQLRELSDAARHGLRRFNAEILNREVSPA